MHFNNLLLTFFFLFIFLIASAQFYASGLEQITRENGLGHYQVECIYQDSYEFIWFGTRNGLSRFGGFDFKAFRSNKDTTSLSGNWITYGSCYIQSGIK